MARNPVTTEDGRWIGAAVDAVVFDVFGTVVDWRPGVADEFRARRHPGRSSGRLAGTHHRVAQPVPVRTAAGGVGAAGSTTHTVGGSTTAAAHASWAPAHRSNAIDRGTPTRQDLAGAEDQAQAFVLCRSG